jgi:hypothetical protein
VAGLGFDPLGPLVAYKAIGPQVILVGVRAAAPQQAHASLWRIGHPGELERVMGWVLGVSNFSQELSPRAATREFVDDSGPA